MKPTKGRIAFNIFNYTSLTILTLAFLVPYTVGRYPGDTDHTVLGERSPETHYALRPFLERHASDVHHGEQDRHYQEYTRNDDGYQVLIELEALSAPEHHG